MRRKLISFALAAAVLCATSRSIGATPTTDPEAVILEDRFGHLVALADGETRSVGQPGLAELAKVSIPKGYRATFCENATPRARCRRLVGANVDDATEFTPPFSTVGTTVRVEKALFGFADLHVHPATHLAWGARGGQGVLWGRPGMAYEQADVAADLAACPSLRDPNTGLNFNIHGYVTGLINPIVAAARFGLLESREENHGSFGYPAFTDWPSASSIIHQQMHVTMLRRAWEGGLRLMVASATDNQMLDIIWNPEFSLSQRRFAFREDADYKSAAEQFDFIRQFVAANASWMMIVKTPAEARWAINQGKLAVVLGLEMDELSAEEILKLKQQYGVALVVPVHLVNNSFGGAAVYDDFFNVANYIMNGEFFRITGDSGLGFQLGAFVKKIPVISDLLGFIPPLPEYFATGNAGHRNRVGLLDEYGMKRLMKAGLLIDTAHMSSNATDKTLALAEPFGYPLVHSHGGKRWGNKPSERGMSDTQFQDLENSGGILGLGTGSDSLPVAPITEWLNHYLEVAQVGPVALGSDLNGMAKQISRSEFTLTYPTDQIVSADWTGRSLSLRMFQLGPKRFDIQDDGIAHIGMLPDFLAVVRQWAEKLGRTREVDQIFHSAHDFIATWEKATQTAPGVNADLPSLPVSRINLTIETGTDDLKCGGVMVSAINRVDGQDRGASLPAIINQGQRAHSTYTMQLQMLPGTQLRDVDKIRFEYLPVKCDFFDTGDAWNIKTLKVAYDIPYNEMRDGKLVPTRALGVLIHKRGAPAKRLDRGTSWTVFTER